MADLAKRRGRCTNFGNNCPIADSNKVVEVDITEDFVCPECQSDLTEIVKKPFPKWIVGAIAAVVLLGGGIGAWLALSGAPEPVAEPAPEPVYATEVVLSQQLLTLQAGQTALLTAEVMPVEADDRSVVWTSADESVAGVEGGTVTAVAEGETTVTATSGDGRVSAAVAVTVAPVPAEEPQVATPAPKPVPAAPAGPVTGRFTGALKNGYPHGTGTLTFTVSRRIDLHDDKARTAAAGEYIIGEWDNGHLVQGRWYDASNNLKETIVLGKAMNPEKDHSLGRCSK